MDIYEIIETLRDMDVPNSGIKSALKKKGFTEEEIAEALPSAKRQTFASDFYDWLAESPRGAEDIEAYIMGKGEYGPTSSNVQKHLSHYTNIADLANRIHAQK